jgi:membrane-associated protease RseP (regulator of RpoE activity)
MRRFGPLVGAVIALSGAARAQDQAPRSGDTVAFQLKNSILFVEATVNGKGPFSFIFDTGAGMTVLKPETAQKLGLIEKADPPADAPPKKRLRPGSLMGEGARLMEVESIAAGKAGATRVQVAVMSVPQADVPLNVLGISYDGILGYTFISRFVTTIDYKAKTIKLVPSDYLPEVLGVPAAASGATLGFSYRTIPDDLANEIGVEGGLEVRAVSAGGPAAAGGLRKGDIVREVNGKRVDTADQYRKFLASIKSGDAITLKVIRERKDVELRLTAGARE